MELPKYIALVVLLLNYFNCASVRCESVGAPVSAVKTKISTFKTKTTSAKAIEDPCDTSLFNVEPTVIGERSVKTKTSASKTKNTSVKEIEGPRDMNLFNVEPTVIDERIYSPAPDVRHVGEDQQIRNMLKSRAGLN